MGVFLLHPQKVVLRNGEMLRSVEMWRRCSEEAADEPNVEKLGRVEKCGDVDAQKDALLVTSATWKRSRRRLLGRKLL